MVWTTCAIGGAIIILLFGLIMFAASLGPARPFLGRSPRLLQMTQKVLTSLLLLLICGSVAAEPTHKQTTAASRRAAAKTQNANTTSKEPAAEETPVKEPPAKEPPANELFGALPVPLRLLLARLVHTHEAALQGR